MAANGNADIPACINLPLDTPSVVLTTGGAAIPFAEVNSIIDSASILHPGRATVTVRNIAAAVEQGFISLTKNAISSLPGFARIVIKSKRDPSATLFIGNLMRPKRSWSDMHDNMVLTFEDDRCWLRKIPMRGCLVYDGVVAPVRVLFLNSYEPRLNPDGYQNCCEVSNGFVKHFYFTQLAAQGTQGINDDSIIGQENVGPQDGISWTALRWLNYIYDYLHISNPTGYLNGEFCNIDTDKIDMFQSLGILDSEEVNRKMPDMSFKGKNVAQALYAFEEVCSVFGHRLIYKSDNTSSIVAYAKHKSTAKDDKTIFVQTSGSPNFKSVWKGEIESDYSNTVVSTLVEGGRPHIEAEFVWTGKPLTSSLVPAWGTIAADGTWSRYGDTVSKSNSTEIDFLKIVCLAKDSNDTVIAGLTKNSPAALNLARVTYPKVFRAFKLYYNGNDIMQRGLKKIMNGAEATAKYGAVTTLLTAYPWLPFLRPFLEAQLQPYIETTELKRADMRVPARIQFGPVCQPYSADPSFTTGWADVGYNNGVRPDKNGLIYFDGLTDDLGTSANPTIYFGSIAGYGTSPIITAINPDDATYPKLKSMLLNIGIAHDFLPGSVLTIGNTNGDPNEIKDELDPSVIPGDYGKVHIQHYIQNSGFKTEHQKNSKPVLPGSMLIGKQGGTTLMPLDYDATGISRELRSDMNQMIAHCKRRHQENCKVARIQKYVLPGCQYTYQAGDFITSLKTSDGVEISVNDFIANIEYNYIGAHQTTTLHFGGGNVA